MRPSSWVACSISLSHEVRVADVDGLERLEDGEDDREADRGLRRREHDDEQGEHLPRDPARHVVVEGDEVHVRAVQDELDAHEDAHGVAPGGDRDETEGEEQRTDGEEVVERDHARSPGRQSALISLRAMTMAPMSVARSTMDATSNGRSHFVRKASPIAWVVEASGAGVRTGHGASAATARSTGAAARKRRTPPNWPKLAFEIFTSVMRLVRKTANRMRTRTPPM